MNYEQFKSLILQQIKQLLPSDTSVQLQTIRKNNGLLLDGLVISNKSSNISPTIFLNYYYEKQSSFPNFDAICRDIVKTYEQNCSKETIDADFFSNYTLICKHIAYRIIHFEKNKELLKTVPYVRYLDLAVVFYCLLNLTNGSYATILIHTSHLTLWNITTAQLYKHACRITPILLPYDFRNMSSVISSLYEQASPNEQPISTPPFCPMYVLTNKKKLYGASCMLYPGLLAYISEKLRSDLFILPSSIHEVIILPAANRNYGKELADMVREINQTELAADEILSNHVYCYSRSKQALGICTYPCESNL